MSIEIHPFADAWVTEFSPDTSHNGDGLGVGRWPRLNRSFLRFAIPSGTYGKATLMIYGQAIKPPARCDVYYCGSGFNEATLTWNNQPPPTTHNGNPGPWGTLDPVPTILGWFGVDIDPEIVNWRAGKNLNLRLSGDESGPDSYFYAEDKEASGGAYAPKLVLYTEIPGTPTKLTIFAPEKVAAGEKFHVTGFLTETETDLPIEYQPVELSYNGRILGAALTTIDGDYLLEVSIPEAGVWTLMAKFYGTEAYAASRSLTDTAVAATPLLIVGPLVAGLALFMYGIS